MKKITRSVEWRVVKTTGSNRVNLFSISSGTSHHVATIISGSISQLDRFDESVAILEASPKMIGLLSDTLEVLNDFGFVQSPHVQELEKKISTLLSGLIR